MAFALYTHFWNLMHHSTHETSQYFTETYPDCNVCSRRFCPADPVFLVRAHNSVILEIIEYVKQLRLLWCHQFQRLSDSWVLHRGYLPLNYLDRTRSRSSWGSQRAIVVCYYSYQHAPKRAGQKPSQIRRNKCCQDNCCLKFDLNRFALLFSP